MKEDMRENLLFLVSRYSLPYFGLTKIFAKIQDVFGTNLGFYCCRV